MSFEQIALAHRRDRILNLKAEIAKARGITRKDRVLAMYELHTGVSPLKTEDYYRVLLNCAEIKEEMIEGIMYTGTAEAWAEENGNKIEKGLKLLEQPSKSAPPG